jgi:hypothetical protein
MLFDQRGACERHLHDDRPFASCNIVFAAGALMRSMNRCT